jgi:hypothetical protein
MTAQEQLGLGELLARVKTATGADRAIDRAIAKHFKIEWDYGADWPTIIDDDGEKTSEPTAYPYTASIDAALALTERMLPGWKWGVSSHSFQGGEHYPDGKPKYIDGFRAHVTKRSALRPMPSIADARTAPLALLAALLSALLNTKENGE